MYMKKKCEMVLAEETRIMESGKNCTIQDACSIWKQKIWLVLSKPYCLVANQTQEFCE